MITCYLWNLIVFDNLDWIIYKTIYLWNILFAVFISIFCLPLDILLLPIEIISFIIYKIIGAVNDKT